MLENGQGGTSLQRLQRVAHGFQLHVADLLAPRDGVACRFDSTAPHGLRNPSASDHAIVVVARRSLG